MIEFDFYVFWDSTMMQLISRDNLADDRGWIVTDDTNHGDWYSLAAEIGSADPWTSDAVWATLTFRCTAKGSSDIVASGEDSVWLTDGDPVYETDFDEDVITVNQVQPPQPRPNPVGGVILPVNELAVLAPYLILVGLITTLSTVYAFMRRRKN